MNFILVLSCLIWVRDAHAYLDPGTGSLIIQSTIAAITGFLFILKTYWHKLKTIFLSKKNRDMEAPHIMMQAPPSALKGPHLEEKSDKKSS